MEDYAVGKFSELDLDHIDDNDLDPEGLKDFLADTELSETETVILQMQCLLSDLISLNERIEAMILRSKYYEEAITLEMIEEVRDSLKAKIRDFQ